MRDPSKYEYGQGYPQPGYGYGQPVAHVSIPHAYGRDAPPGECGLDSWIVIGEKERELGVWISVRIHVQSLEKNKGKGIRCLDLCKDTRTVIAEK